MTIARMLLGRQFYDLQPSQRLKYRPGPPLRQRLDRRHADAFRGAAGAHGARVLGLVDAVHARALRLARHRRHRRVDRGIFLVFRREFAGSRRAAGAGRRAAGGRPGATHDAPAGAAMAHRGARRLHDWTVFTAHYPVFSSAGSSSSSARAATAAYQSRIDLKPPLLVGFFLAGLVIHGGLQGWWIIAGAREPVADAALSRLDAADGVQRQRADHLPGDARAEPRRPAEDRGRRRRRHRRRTDSDRQRAEPGRPGILGRFFDGAIRPAGLLLGAVPPTIVVIAAFQLC